MNQVETLISEVKTLRKENEELKKKLGMNIKKSIKKKETADIKNK